MQFGSKGNIKLRLRERARKVEMDGEIIIEQVVIFFFEEGIAIFTNCRLYDRRFITSSTLLRNKDSFVVRHFYGFTGLR